MSRQSCRSRLHAACRSMLAGALALFFLLPTVQNAAAMEVERPERTQADTSYYGWLTVPEEDTVARAELPEQGLALTEGQTVSLTLDIPQAGEYAVAVSYHADQNVVLDSTMTVVWAGLPVVKTAVYSLWQDETKEYALDRYGNEVTSLQTTLDTPVEDYVRDSTSMDAAPVLFSLKAGRQTVQVCSDNQPMHLYRFRVVRQPEILTAGEYRARHDGPAYTGAPVIVEGEDYAVKSDSFIRSKAESNSGVYPYSPYYKWMATVDGVSWNAVGQRVLWNITVPQDGWYQVAFHYSQSSQEGQEIYRTLEIDGQIPADSFREMPFSYTGSPYAYNIPEDALWLTKGRHTLGMMAESSQTATLVDDVQTLMEELSDIGLSLQQVAGSSADKNRSWDIETYIPGVIGHMRDIQSRLRTLYDTLEKQYGEVPANCLNLRLADDMIEQILKKPEKMPTRIEEISVGSGSITNLLVELINKWKNQGLSLDRIYLMEKGTELPAANGSFWSNLINGVKRFFNALTSREANYSASATGDRQTLSVWVNRSVPYVETMQMLADSRYKGVDADGNPLSVQFSIMPDEGKLLLANASNTCPDVALSVTGDRAYQLGLRHAVAPLSDFPDFTGYITGKFLDSAFEPYLHDGRVYGLPETQDFYVLLYRRDILEKLKLQVPRTWSDLAELMPALRRSGMNFYMPLSSQTGTKSLSYIAPFYFQAAIASGENPDYSLWSEDGTSVNFNNETGIRAFQELTDLYLLYGLQNNMPSFYNNFRYGVTPLGIGSFANYVQLLYAAPEIAGQWGVAPALGFSDEKGNLCNQMPSFDRSAIIMDSSLKKEAGWDFIKWWMSTETQAEFAQTLQAKFGSEFVWNSANLEAFAQLAIPSADREVILQQWENAVNLRYLPATYMMERSLSDAWYKVTQGQQPVRIALNEAAVSVEQELILKLQEFGYLNDAEEPIKPYDMRQWAAIRQELFRE